MDRKEWLEAFLRCVDTGASTLDFRRYCRVKAQHLPRHMRQVQSYRDELARLLAEETTHDEECELEPQAEPAVTAELPGEIEEESEEVEESCEEEADEPEQPTDSPFTWDYEETLGPRDDSGDEPDLHD